LKLYDLRKKFPDFAATTPFYFLKLFLFPPELENVSLSQHLYVDRSSMAFTANPTLEFGRLCNSSLTDSSDSRSTGMCTFGPDLVLPVNGPNFIGIQLPRASFANSFTPPGLDTYEFILDFVIDCKGKSDKVSINRIKPTYVADVKATSSQPSAKMQIPAAAAAATAADAKCDGDGRVRGIGGGTAGEKTAGPSDGKAVAGKNGLFGADMKPVAVEEQPAEWWRQVCILLGEAQLQLVSAAAMTAVVVEELKEVRFLQQEG
uniref:CUB domain-containing protein n=1 Tax=Schistocephalus solidus TaxID=70667 RepID=A0A183SNA4_SCHSO